MKKYIFSTIFAVSIIISGIAYYFYFSLHPADKLHICVDMAMDEKSYDPSDKADIKAALNQIWDYDCQDQVVKYQKEILKDRREKDNTTIVLFKYEDFEDTYQEFKKIGVRYLVEEVYYVEK